MTDFTSFHYDPARPEVVRLQVEGLCTKLEELKQRLTDRKLKFEELKEDFDRLYRPDALALAKAMLYYVPDDDSRIMMVGRVDNQRTFKSDDITIIGLPIRVELASAHLDTKLRALVVYLPKN